MTVGQNTVDLWKRSPLWRGVLICAVIATALAIKTGAFSSPGGGAPSGSAPVAGSTGGGSPAPGASAQQCGPQGQTTVSAPIVVSSTGSVPSNVQTTGSATVASGGLPSPILSRFRQFVTQVDAANMEQRSGERCVRMNGALSALEPSDYAYADCFSDGQQKLVAAQACSSDFTASETRFERLVSGFEATRSDNSAELIEELARARERMLPFDETRERWGLSDAAVEAGNRAIGTIAASDRRIAALDAAGALDSSTPQGLAGLAATAELTAFDRTRLSEQSRATLARAEAAKAQLAESDRRLAAIGDALQGAPAATSASRSALIAALSALTGLDLSRATDAQRSLIERARAAAAEFALSDLIDAARGLDLSAASAEELQRLRDLAQAARENGSAATGTAEGGQTSAAGTATDEAARAFDLADRAAGLLGQGDRRIADMRAMVARIEAGGPSALGGEVIAAHEAITAFDRDRMTEEDLRALDRLAEARDITLASRDGVLTRSVPLHLGAEASDELTMLAVAELRRDLEDRGFTIVDAMERAAIAMTLSLSDIDQQSVTFSGSSVNTALVNLTVVARWTVEDEPLPIPRTEGSAVGDDFYSLSRQAVSGAARATAQEIETLAEN